MGVVLKVLDDGLLEAFEQLDFLFVALELGEHCRLLLLELQVEFFENVSEVGLEIALLLLHDDEELLQLELDVHAVAFILFDPGSGGAYLRSKRVISERIRPFRC